MLLQAQEAWNFKSEMDKIHLIIPSGVNYEVLAEHYAA